MNNFSAWLQENDIILSNQPAQKAAFITEDGYFINLQENKLKLIGYQWRDVIHSDLFRYLQYKGLKVEYSPKEKDKYNLIKLNDGSYIMAFEELYIDLPSQEITKAQYDSLLKWLDFVTLKTKKRTIYVGISSSRGKQYEIASPNNPNGLLPEDIIKEIRKIYALKKTQG